MGRLEAAIGLEPTYTGFADQGMTTLPRRSGFPPTRRRRGGIHFVPSSPRRRSSCCEAATPGRATGRNAGLRPRSPCSRSRRSSDTSFTPQPDRCVGPNSMGGAPWFRRTGARTNKSPGADGGRGSKAFDASWSVRPREWLPAGSRRRSGRYRGSRLAPDRFATTAHDLGKSDPPVKRTDRNLSFSVNSLKCAGRHGSADPARGAQAKKNPRKLGCRGSVDPDDARQHITVGISPVAWVGSTA